MSLKQLGIGAMGIYGSYLTYSLLTEKLYLSSYQSTQDPTQFDKFRYPSLIVWFSYLLCGIFGYAKSLISKQPPNPIPEKQKVILGLIFAANNLTSNYSLLYISYLEHSLGRNCRYLMVVIVGAYFSRVQKGSNLKLKPKKIIVAALITMGVLMFTLCGNDQKGEASVEHSDAWKGYLLILASITFDALFSDSQAYAKATYKPTPNHLFTSMAFMTAIIVFAFGLFKGEGLSQIQFVYNHPTVFVDILTIALLQVFGQISINYIVAHFKQHIFPLISTTRKVLTVLLSILIYGHHVNMPQWFSIILVFGGLVYELKEQLGKKHQKLDKNVENTAIIDKQKSI